MNLNQMDIKAPNLNTLINQYLLMSYDNNLTAISLNPSFRLFILGNNSNFCKLIGFPRDICYTFQELPVIWVNTFF